MIEVLINAIRIEKKNKGHSDWKRKLELFLTGDYIIVYMENTYKGSTKFPWNK